MDTIQQVYKILLKEYGQQGWWPIINDKTLLSEYHKEAPKNEEEAFEICIGAILTQNTNWQNVEKAISNLKKQNMLSSKRLEEINTEKLAVLIKPSGYYNQKAKKIKAFIKFLKSDKDINRENLLSIWGVGPETADSILLYAYDQPVFVIDAYTKRVTNRLGFKEKTYDELQKLFMQNLPRNVQLYNEFHALFVKLGKYFCKKKPLCQSCPLVKICPTVVKSGHESRCRKRGF